MAISKATASSVAPAAKGDLVVGSGTNDAAVLAVGSANQVLTVDSSTTTGLKWAAAGSGFVGCKAKKTSTQSLDTATDVLITWDSEDFDTDAFHDNSTNNSRITIPSGKGGKYLIIVGAGFASNATGRREISVVKNGASNVAYTMSAPTPTSLTAYSVTGIADLSATDYLQVYANQTSGSTIDFLSSNTFFAVYYLGA